VLRVFSSPQGTDNLIARQAVAKRESPLTRMASDLFRRFVEPPIIDHASGIYSAQRPPFFAARRPDDF
jgi:hypothetical protein